jgi:hypothetical protein
VHAAVTPWCASALAVELAGHAVAKVVLRLTSHTEPHSLFLNTSTRPSFRLGPFTRRIVASRSGDGGSGCEHRGAAHMLRCM